MSAPSRRTDEPMATRQLAAIGAMGRTGILVAVFGVSVVGTVGCEPPANSRTSERATAHKAVAAPQPARTTPAQEPVRVAIKAECKAQAEPNPTVDPAQGDSEDRAEKPIVVDTMSLDLLKRMKETWDGIEVTVTSASTEKTAPKVAQAQGQSEQGKKGEE